MNLRAGGFEPIYQNICGALFSSQSKASLDVKIKKLTGYNIHAKLFLVALFITLNAIDKNFVEKAKTLALGILPLMFSDKEYREEVEKKLSEEPNINTLVSNENKTFY